MVRVQPRPQPSPAAKHQYVNQAGDDRRDTANGKSMSVISRLLPRNSNFAIAHAAHKRRTTRFSGTAMAAVINVSLIAESDVRICKAAKYAPAPRRSASVKTETSGNNRNTPKNEAKGDHERSAPTHGSVMQRRMARVAARGSRSKM